MWKSISGKIESTVKAIIVYSIICLVIAIGFTAGLYFLFTRFFEDIMVVKVLGVGEVERFCTPSYWWSFSIANVFYTYWMMKKEVASVD